MNLAGVSALPIAEILRDRRIPFLFSTGYGANGVTAPFEKYPVLAKPFVIADLMDKIRAARELDL